MQLPFPEMMPESFWRTPDDFPDLVGRGAKGIGFDLETCDPKLTDKGPGFMRGDAFIAGYSIYTEDGFNRYYPVRHAQGTNLPPNLVAEWVSEQLSTDIPKYMANRMYDLEGCWSEGIRNICGPVYDIQVAEALIDEETSKGYGLKALSEKYLGVGKVEELLKEAAQMYSHGGKRKGKGNVKFHEKKDLWLMDAKYVGPYAEGDSIETSLIFKQQKKILEDEDLMEVFHLETDLAPILLEMRVKGIRVDVEAAESLVKDLTREIDQLSKEIWSTTGFDVNVDSGKQLLRAYEAYNTKSIAKVSIRYIAATNNASFNKEWLEAQEDPLSKLVLRKRKLMTMRDDFVLGDILGEQVNGRVHAQFHQLRQDDRGTRSGRFSSTNPNLQQVPKRDKVWGPKIRSLFVADFGKKCMKADYSQQEPRLLLHFADACGLPGAAEAVQTFKRNPRTDYHDYTKEICNANTGRTFERGDVKDINLGTMYSMGLKKLCRKLKVSEEVGRAILEAYHSALPFVKTLSTKAMSIAQTRGFIKTLLGRKRRFNLYEPVAQYKEEILVLRGLPFDEAQKRWPNHRLQRWGTHKALNSLIQGSAADQTKKAMILLYREFGKVPSIQVHDELVASVEDMEEARIYKRVMEQAVILRLPVVCDAQLGPSWGNAKEEVFLEAA